MCIKKKTESLTCALSSPPGNSPGHPPTPVTASAPLLCVSEPLISQGWGSPWPCPQQQPSSQHHHLYNHCPPRSRGPGVFTHMGCTQTHTPVYPEGESLDEPMWVSLCTQVGSLTQTQACRPCPDHTWLLESPLDASWSKWPKPRRKDAKSSSNVSCLQGTKSKWFHSKSLTHSADNFKTSEGHDCPSRINTLHSLLPDPGGWALFIAPSPCMTEATKAVCLADRPLFYPPSPCPWSFLLISPLGYSELQTPNFQPAFHPSA